MFWDAGRRKEFPQQSTDELGRYRHKVFVSHLGWRLQTTGDIESDEFDGPETVYVYSRDEFGMVNGIARLLPTTTPYLMEKVFPALWARGSLPQSAHVWELSRFASVDFNKTASVVHQATSKSAAGLFKYVIEMAARYGAKELITVSPIGMERLLALNGYRAQRAGLPMKINEGIIVALKIPFHTEPSRL
jgi:acyl homoserine lactone synthase